MLYDDEVFDIPGLAEIKFKVKRNGSAERPCVRREGFLFPRVFTSHLLR